MRCPDISLSREQVRRADQYAILRLDIPGAVLMENAGRQVADAAMEWLDSEKAAVGVVAGGGNNGGDGFVAARHLALRGWSVVVFLLRRPEEFGGDAALNLRIIQKLALEIRVATVSELAGELSRFDLLLDAIGGTGILGPLRGPTADAVVAMNASGRPILAVDIPTGLDCDTGRAESPAIHASATVTFVARKKGFDFPGSEAFTGRVVVADIGLPLTDDVLRALNG